MNIFLSSRYSRRDEMRGVRTRLEEAGHTVTSRWLDTSWCEQDESGGSSAAPPEYREQYAVSDLEDVAAADCLIAFTEAPRSGGRGGRHAELGAALALGKQVIVVGHRENIFCHHPAVVFCDGWLDLVRAVAQAHEATLTRTTSPDVPG